VVLLTADDISNALGETTLRARQNVIFELGYFCASLGRDRVCLVYQQGVELPSDLKGVLYYPFTESVREVEPAIRTHMQELGLLGGAAEPAILVVDDDLTWESPLIKQLQAAVAGRAKIQLMNNPEEAAIRLARGYGIVGCITDVVFRGFSVIAGVAVAEAALQKQIDIVVFSGHRRNDIGVAWAELERIGITGERVLAKPTSLQQYRRFLALIRQRFLGLYD
jgi:hypothetical protein